MDAAELESYLRAHIPLSAAMGVRVDTASVESVVLTAPLAPNINHRDTVFGGSASALAILAAWALVHIRLVSEGRTCRIVIQHNIMDYDAPLLADFSATTLPVDQAAWQRFLDGLDRRGKARIVVSCDVRGDGLPSGRFEGTFVAIRL